jgi:WD40 repeat protein
MAYDHLGILKLATGEVMFKIPFVATRGRNFDFSPDGSLLAVTSYDGKLGRIDLVDLRIGKLERFTSPDFAPSKGHFCIDGGLVARLPALDKAICWNVRDKSIRWETKPSEVHCYGTGISPDRKWFITASRQDITVIDCATGSIRYRTQCEYLVDAIAFLPNGRSFVTVGWQGQVSIWQASTGKHLFELANIGANAWSQIQPLEHGFLVSKGVVKDGRTERRWIEF